jgi:excisionase family DNA binding protein
VARRGRAGRDLIRGPAGSSDDRLTLAEAAERLRVHYMTVYRYVRTGLLPAEKRDGEWRVRASAVTDLRRVPKRLRRGPGPARSPRLEARLLAGDEPGAWAVVERALASGTDPTSIYLDVLTPALRSLGERWARGAIDVGDEHRATCVAIRLVGKLGPAFRRPGRRRGRVVVGAPAGEQHALPVAMLADVLRGSGFEVSELGCHVPLESFVREAATQPDVVAVAVSVTTPRHRAAAGRVVAAVRARLGEGVPVLVGGGAIPDERAALRLGADGWGTDARAAVRGLEAALAAARDGDVDRPGRRPVRG